MSALHPRIQIWGPVTRSSRMPSGSVSEQTTPSLLVREVFRIVFFLPHDHFDLAERVSRTLDVYLSAVRGQREALSTYICGGWQAFDWGTRGEALIRAALRPTERTHFEDYSEHEARAAEKEGASPNILIQGEPGSGYGFDYRARLPFRETPEGYVSVLGVTVPTEFLEQQGAEALRELALGMAVHLPFTSGHAGLALDIAPACADWPPALRALMAQHPGFDLRNATLRDFMGTRIDGVHWLNFLGPPVLDELGGVAGLHERLGSGLSVQSCGEGRALVTLGARPDAGDLVLGQTLPEYRELARVLEPWLEPFDPGFLSFSDPADDPETLRGWWRRFLD